MGLQILRIGPLILSHGIQVPRMEEAPASRNAPKAEVNLSGLLQKGKLFDLRDFWIFD